VLSRSRDLSDPIIDGRSFIRRGWHGFAYAQEFTCSAIANNAEAGKLLPNRLEGDTGGKSGLHGHEEAFAARELHAMLNVIRIQIEFLEASVKHEPEDRELEKRVKRAKN
jgi:hypothetical protein